MLITSKSIRVALGGLIGYHANRKSGRADLFSHAAPTVVIMHRINRIAAFFLLVPLVLVSVPTSANVVLINDTTAGTATNDGTINGGEYVGSGTGINSGFGNVIGSGSTMYMDSSSGGGLNIGIRKGGGSFNDKAVIYIDSKSGGFTSTGSFNDNADGGRAALSGLGAFGGRSTLNFANGFSADYGIAIDGSFAGLFELTTGSHNFITTANLTHTGNDYELNLTLSNIGSTPGTAFKYVATYLNSDNAFRSDEFHGVASFGPGNPGNNTVSLADGDFNTFVSYTAAVPEPSPVLAIPTVLLVAGMILAVRRGCRRPHAVPVSEISDQ
jgi:hypothetical protein